MILGVLDIGREMFSPRNTKMTVAKTTVLHVGCSGMLSCRPFRRRSRKCAREGCCSPV